MSRYERNVYFEKLVTLKLRPWGDDDRTSVISIEDVIVYAEAVMLATEMELELAEAEDAAERPSAETEAVVPAAETPARATAETPAAESDGAPNRPPRSRRLMDGWFGGQRGADTGA